MVFFRNPIEAVMNAAYLSAERCAFDATGGKIKAGHEHQNRLRGK